MPIAQLTILPPLNTSIQPGDMLYYITASTQTGYHNMGNSWAAPGTSAVYEFQTHTAGAQIFELGEINSINEVDIYNDGTPDNYVINVNIPQNVQMPVQSDFLFFGKDKTVNEASVIGYFAEFKFQNSSRQPAELFAATCDISESSK